METSISHMLPEELIIPSKEENWIILISIWSPGWNKSRPEKAVSSTYLFFCNGRFNFLLFNNC